LVAGGVFAVLVGVDSLVRGEILVPALFVALYVLAAFGMVYGNFRRRPARLGFSSEEVQVEYRDGRTRLLPWEKIASVRLGHFFSDVFVDICYVDGKEEDRAHIYGDAAIELKKRFDALPTARGR
jgi:hypothetical protein